LGMTDETTEFLKYRLEYHKASAGNNSMSRCNQNYFEQQGYLTGNGSHQFPIYSVRSSKFGTLISISLREKRDEGDIKKRLLRCIDSIYQKPYLLATDKLFHSKSNELGKIPAIVLTS
jgi:hypothetical protein